MQVSDFVQRRGGVLFHLRVDEWVDLSLRLQSRTRKDPLRCIRCGAVTVRYRMYKRHTAIRTIPHSSSECVQYGLSMQRVAGAELVEGIQQVRYNP